jgi:hypothetical protein
MGAIAFPVAMVLRVETGWPAVLRLIAGTGLAGTVYLVCALLVPGVFLGADIISFADERLPRGGPAGKLRRLIVGKRGKAFSGADGGN